jgi:phage terminase large subunit-like protein
MIKRLHIKHQFVKLFVETNAFQKSLMYQQELQGLPLAESPTDRDKERRFISMSSHFESGRILVNPLLAS